MISQGQAVKNSFLFSYVLIRFPTSFKYPSRHKGILIFQKIEFCCSGIPGKFIKCDSNSNQPVHCYASVKSAPLIFSAKLCSIFITINE